MYTYDTENDCYDKSSDYDEDVDYDLSQDTFSVTSGQPLVFLSRQNSRKRRPGVAHLARIVSRRGRLNTFISHPSKHLYYIKDLGTTLLTIRWRWILITLCIVNFCCFLLFGLLYMVMARVSGDFDKDATDFCIVNTNTLIGYILLSIETVMTIGYGYRYPTEKCVQGWILPTLQAFVSVAVQGVLVSAVYVKIAKPFARDALFSRKAVICLRDGKLCLVLRIVDIVGKVSVGTTIKMYFMDKDAACDDGQAQPSVPSLHLQQIKVEPHGFLLMPPAEVVHVIDPQSPLWDLAPLQLLTKRFEIIVVAEGSSMVTGQLSQSRTSYTNSEVMWGHRFRPCLEFDEKKLRYLINYKHINKTTSFDTPLCSAKELRTLEDNYL